MAAYNAFALAMICSKDFCAQGQVSHRAVISLTVALETGKRPQVSKSVFPTRKQGEEVKLPALSHKTR
jgi:hypothetical protein